MAETKKSAAKKTVKKATPVVAKKTCRIVWDGGNAIVYMGQSYPGDHPAVKAQPDLFDSELDPFAPYVAQAGRRGVERATAAPGEKRG